MATKKNNELQRDFPGGLAQPALRALAAAGFTRLDQLTTITAAELGKLHGMGPKGIRLLQVALQAKGLDFAGLDPDQPSPAPVPVPAPNWTSAVDPAQAPVSARAEGPAAVSEPSAAEAAASPEAVIDSPTTWVRNHILEYVATSGEKGYLWRGYPTLLLTTRGRKSGQLRRTALIFGRDGDRYLVVASKGGAPQHPLWYLNLLDHPEVEIQVGDQKIAGRARPASLEEKPRLWNLMASVYPPYLEYQAKTARDIPVVIIEPNR